jgi:type II secretory pathway component GspD/PulD (secretin)
MRTKLATLVLAATLLCVADVRPAAAQQPLGVKVVQLKHADARKTADILTAILGGRGGLRLAVDDRTNSVVFAADAQTTDLAEKLIARFDKPLAPKK